MHIHFLGGAMEIGGSCIYLRAAGKGILLDCGIRQSGSKDPLPDFCAIQSQGGLDAIVISHAHMDHIGTLPMISKAYPQARIYMTAMTADLTRTLLYDSLKIMDGREDEIPHYSEQDVQNMLSRILPLRYQAPFPLWEGTSLTFYPAGHIAGAACICLVTEEGTLFYSGDFAGFSQRTIEGIRIPKLRPDIAIVESTYGNRLHANRQVEERRLISLVRECVEQGQKILIPAFALGRAQEVLLILRAAIQNREIPAVPVFADGMVREINTMYTRNPTFLKNALGKRILKGNEPFYTKEIQPVAPTQKRDALLSIPGPLILVSSSGMLTGGPSSQYARQLAPSEHACIIITGYQDEESPGRQLLNLLEQTEPDRERTLTLNGVTVPVRCRIEQVGLSAHGDKAEILAMLARISPRHIFLVHGNEASIQELGGEVAAEDCRRRVYLPECGQDYEISLKKIRKQLSFTPKFTLQRQEAFRAEDGKELWEYWREHYFGKRLTVSQIAHIWHGIPVTEEPPLKELQERLLSGPYFSRNMRQLFLFEANSEETVARALTPKEWTMQELEPRIRDLFQGYDYRKIGYHRDTREILLQFDYPDALNLADFHAKAKAFMEETGWAAAANPSMNHNAAGNLLFLLFSDRLLKISYFLEQKYYAVTLSAKQQEDAAAAEEFTRRTGWRLCINGEFCSKPFENSENGGSQEPCQNLFPVEFAPSDSDARPIEQNLAFSCMDQEFTGLPHSIEKKSLKQDANGPYLEAAFLSPAIGRIYAQKLQALADRTGWRIRIADKVNQNALFQVAQMLCAQYGIPLVKNPSYLPGKKALRLKVPETADPKLQTAIAEEFKRRTGCACEFVSS